MIIVISGVSGVGKSFFKNVMVQELNFKNLVIVTTRDKRKNETNGIDKNFVTEEQFELLRKSNEMSYNFELLGIKYGYMKKDVMCNLNQVTELHYSEIYDFKKKIKDVFSIYILPNDFERAKLEVKKRELSKEVERKRLEEMQEQMEVFSKDKQLQQQFDCVFVNNYTEQSKKQLIEIIRKKMKVSI